MKYQVKSSLTIDFTNLDIALKMAKNLKADDVIIPRFLSQFGTYEPKSRIIGQSYKSIVITATFDANKYVDFNDQSSSIVRWPELWPTNKFGLEYICLHAKDISPFYKAISDYNAATYGDPKRFIKFVTIDYTVYHINDQNISIAHRIYYQDPKNPNLIISSIELLPYGQLLQTIESMISYYCKSNILSKTDISDNPTFLAIQASKASDGVSMFQIDTSKELHKLGGYDSYRARELNRKYTLFLGKSMLNVAKGDRTILTLSNRIPDFPNNRFFSHYEVDKPKKRMKLDYYMLNMDVD